MGHKSPFFAPRRGYHHGSLKDALIDAARHLVAERGAAGFTLSEAAKRVGVTAAAPYRHFTDRNDLMGELARRGFEVFGAKLEAAFEGGRPDAKTALMRMGASYLAFAREEPGLYNAMFANAATLSAPGPAAAADRALDVLLRSAVAVLREGGRGDADARSLAFQIWSLSHGVSMLMLSGHLAKDAGGDPERTLMDGVEAMIAATAR
jgi:AcrR family transcriptional regulator